MKNGKEIPHNLAHTVDKVPAIRRLTRELSGVILTQHSKADEMRTFIAVVSGLAVTAFLILVGESSLARVADAPTSVFPLLVALFWTFIALTLGALVAMRISPMNETVAGFIVGELFFGAGFLHRFWHATAWYNVLALFLMFPAALLGAWIASQLKFGSQTGARSRV